MKASSSSEMFKFTSFEANRSAQITRTTTYVKISTQNVMKTSWAIDKKREEIEKAKWLALEAERKRKIYEENQKILAERKKQAEEMRKRQEAERKKAEAAAKALKERLAEIERKRKAELARIEKERLAKIAEMNRIRNEKIAEAERLAKLALANVAAQEAAKLKRAAETRALNDASRIAWLKKTAEDKKRREVLRAQRALQYRQQLRQRAISEISGREFAEYRKAEHLRVFMTVA